MYGLRFSVNFYIMNAMFVDFYAWNAIVMSISKCEREYFVDYYLMNAIVFVHLYITLVTRILSIHE